MRAGIGAALALALCGQACAGPSEEAGFRGVVRDSVTGEVVHGIFVYAGTDSAQTDVDGHFDLSVPAGQYHVRVISIDHEPYGQDLVADRDRELSFLLRRNAPFVHDVSIGPAGIVTATIEDLQSGSLLQNGEHTWVIYYSPTILQSSTIYSDGWDWQRLDERSWRVAIHTDDPAITAVSWQLSDLVSSASFYCPVAAGGCAEQ